MPLEPTRRKLEERVLALENELLEQQTFNQELLTAQEEYRLLVENSTDVIWAADLNLRFTYFSPSVYKLRGYTPEEAVAMGPEDTFTADSLERVRGVVEDLLKPTKTRAGDSARHFKIELECLCKDGSTKWLEIVGATIRNSKGEPTGVQGIGRDISRHKDHLTMLKSTDKALNAKLLELEETNKAVEILTKEANESTREYKAKVVGLIKRLTKPYLDTFRETNPDKNQRICLDFVESCLNDIENYVPGESDEILGALNAKEAEVARLVYLGCTSRDISGLLGIPKRSVDFYRAKIRKKLGLVPPGKSLSQYLLAQSRSF